MQLHPPVECLISANFSAIVTMWYGSVQFRRCFFHGCGNESVSSTMCSRGKFLATVWSSSSHNSGLAREIKKPSSIASYAVCSLPWK